MVYFLKQMLADELGYIHVSHHEISWWRLIEVERYFIENLERFRGDLSIDQENSWCVSLYIRSWVGANRTASTVHFGGGQELYLAIPTDIFVRV
jgi:hypothetical protein